MRRRGRGLESLHAGRRWLVALAICGALALVGGGLWVYPSADTSNVRGLCFANEFEIPPPLEPRVDDAGLRLTPAFRVRASASTVAPLTLAKDEPRERDRDRYRLLHR